MHNDMYLNDWTFIQLISVSVLFKVIFVNFWLYSLIILQGKWRFFPLNCEKEIVLGAGQLSEEIQRLLWQCQLAHSEDREQMPPFGVWSLLIAEVIWAQVKLQPLIAGRRHRKSMYVFWKPIFLTNREKTSLRWGIYSTIWKRKFCLTHVI